MLKNNGAAFFMKPWQHYHLLFSPVSCTELLHFKDFMPWIVELDAPVGLFMNEMQLNGAERSISDVFLKLNFKSICLELCIKADVCLREYGSVQILWDFTVSGVCDDIWAWGSYNICQENRCMISSVVWVCIWWIAHCWRQLDYQNNVSMTSD